MGTWASHSANDAFRVRVGRPAQWLLAGLLLMSMGACVEPNRDGVIRIAAFAPSGGWTGTRVLSPWIGELDRALGAEIAVQFHPGGSLGRHPHAQLDMVTERIVDAAYIVPGYTPGEFPDNELFEIPGLLPDIGTASLASWRMMQQGWLDGYDRLKVLALFTSNPYHLHLREPVRSLEDLRGRKIRITGSMQAAAVAALGAVPIGGIVAPQLADSIDKGVIDGALFSWDLAHIYGVWQVTSHHVDFPLGYTNLMLAMNRDAFDALPGDARAALEALSGEPLIERFVAASRELADLGYADAIESGEHTVVQLSSAQVQRWRARLAPLLEARKRRVARTDRQLEALERIVRDLENL